MLSDEHVLDQVCRGAERSYVIGRGIGQGMGEFPRRRQCRIRAVVVAAVALGGGKFRPLRDGELLILYRIVSSW